MPRVYHSDESISEETDFEDSFGSDSEEGFTKKKKTRLTPTKPKSVKKKVPRKPAKKQSTPKKDLKRKSTRAKTPQKPLSAYMSYRNANLPEVKKNNPTLSFADLSKLIADSWKELPETEKEAYIKLAEADKMRYQDELATYTPSGDEDDDDVDTVEDYDDDDMSDEIASRPTKKYANTRASPKKKAKKNKVGPKKPLNAYLIFVNSERDQCVRQHPTWPITEVVRHLGRLWKNMDEDDKKVYNDLAANDRERYEREVRDFGFQ
jgi:hypothetical protein